MTPKKIKRLLIANRGEIARRIQRTAHRMGIATVAVFSEADAQALHVQEADAAVALGGNLPADSYLRIDKLLAAARNSGADAVHPGYGFLSENADFAQAVVDAGLIWVGPPPAAIRALGNKASAKQLALGKNVPCLPGYQAANPSDTELTAGAEKLGYPIMVKATAGGGGRGMRLVQDAAGLAAALQSARSEALSSFGSDELLLERALLAPRHVEVQVFADAHGHCIHLGERDCSVQRRHQKLIEESPSPAVDADLRERLGACAVALAQAAGYVGAGTVEFLVDASPHPRPLPEGEAAMPRVEEASVGAFSSPAGATDLALPVRRRSAPAEGSAIHEVTNVGVFSSPAGAADLALPVRRRSAPPGGSEVHEVTSVGANFYLMEMNTRLQVEHPVTEAVTGLDLVEWQLRIAQGEMLPLRQDEVSFNGHAIEVRLCAEDAYFSPHTGQVLHFAAPSHARFDHALHDGTEVSPFYDSMLGKLIVHGASRADTIDRLIAALGHTRVLGLPTNRAFLAACLDHRAFRAGQALIPFLAEQGEAIRLSLADRQAQVLTVACIAVHFGRSRGAAADLPLPFAKNLRMQHGENLVELDLTETGRGGIRVASGGQVQEGSCARLTAHTWSVTLNAISHAVHAVLVDGNRWNVQVGPDDLWLEDRSLVSAASAASGSQSADLRAPFNGKVIAIHAAVGDTVQRGHTLVVIESMKLEHAVCATRDGVVSGLAIEPGQQVAPGQVLLTLGAAS